jgi:peptide chain release factor 1
VYGGSFKITLLISRPGFVCFRVYGAKVEQAFKGEAGVHRWQRVPPTEKRGRVHTSTITVAVLPEPKSLEVSQINKVDFEIKTTRGSGPGGQHRNKTDSAVQIKHLPSGIMVRCESERSQTQNKDEAMKILLAKLAAIQKTETSQIRESVRREQVKSGSRGEEKIRTVHVQHDTVYDHLNNQKIPFKDYVRGKLERLN